MMLEGLFRMWLIRKPAFLLFGKWFVAGERMVDAIKASKRLNEKGISTLINILGEHIENKKKIKRITDEYLKLLDRIKEEGLDSGISIKLTQLGLDAFPVVWQLEADEICKENVRRILEKAKKNKIPVEFDMESSAYIDRTIGIFASFLPEFDNIRLAIQTRLHRTPFDLQRLQALNFKNPQKVKTKIRLCKGGYPESPDMALTREKDIWREFSKLAELLLNHGNFPAFATHDKTLINSIIFEAKWQNIEKNKFEFQLLYGIGRKLQKELADQGYKVRAYVPYGPNWIPYGLRRWRFVLKRSLRK